MIRQVTLEAKGDAAHGQKRLLTPGQVVTIGRTESADWTFPHDPEMSGRHFSVAFDAETCRLRDLGSRNGSWVNGERVAATTLRDGDQIRAGRNAFLVRVEQGAPTTSVPGACSTRESDQAARDARPPVLAAPPAPELVPAPPRAEPKALPVASGIVAIAGVVTLRVTAGPHAGQQIWLQSGQTATVGATASADFPLPRDEYLSRVHFELQHAGDQCVVRDRHSTNGVSVNGVPVREARLNPGDQIHAGRSTFIAEFNWAAGRQTPEPTTAVRKTVGSRESGLAPSAPVAATKDVELAPEPQPSATMAAEPVPLLQIVNETPFAVGLFPRENLQGEPRLTVIVKATWQIGRDGVLRLAEPQWPVFTTDRHFGDNPLASIRFESDMVPFKPRADIVLVGRAHAPHGRRVTQLDVRLRVGAVDRAIRVFGDRRWSFASRLVLVPTISAPEPFTVMELVYERAFGGIDTAAARYCDRNLAGVGFIGAATPASIHDKPLPNLEEPTDLIHSWDSRPKPVGFAFYGRGWQPRLRFAGTYNERYRKERAPLWPEDFAYDFFNGAHPALQVEGHLRGDEEVQLEHLTPEGCLQFQLPGRRPTVSVVRHAVIQRDGAASSGPAIATRREERLPLTLDTLVLVPDERLLYIVFRGTCPVQSLEDPDIARVQVTTGGE